MLWPRACRIWLWNGPARWWTVYWGVRNLAMLYTYAFHASNPERSTTPATEPALREAKMTPQDSGRSGQLCHRFQQHLRDTNTAAGSFANKVLTDPVRRESVLSAGGYDELAASPCAANLAMWLYTSAEFSSRPTSQGLLEKTEASVREAIADANPGSREAV